MSDLKQLDRVEATFQPQRTDGLKPGVQDFIGTRCVWEALWEIEEGPYEGLMACSPLRVFKAPFVWAPECDLADLKAVEWAAEETS